MVTGNDTDPNYVEKNKDADGNDSQGWFLAPANRVAAFTLFLLAGMLWRVNGMIMLSKGANMIPMEELEGRMNAEAHRQLVVSSRDGRLTKVMLDDKGDGARHGKDVRLWMASGHGSARCAGWPCTPAARC